MTVDRRNLMVRSLAALDDEKSIETRPLVDIKDDLAALGIDPSASIEAAHARARKRTSPAERLLARLDEGDLASEDIDALENSDIEDLKKTIPDGIAASVAADAKRRAGVPTNVTRLQRQRPSSRFWSWGGSMVGLAACLLLFFVIRPDQLYQIEPSMIDDADNVGALSQSTSVVDTELDQTLEVIESLRLAEETATAADDIVPFANAEPRASASGSAQEREPRSIVPKRAVVTTKSLAVEDSKAGPTKARSGNVQSLSEEGNKQGEQNRSIAAQVQAPAMVPSDKPMMKPLSTKRDVDATKPAIDKNKHQPVQTALQEQDRDTPNLADGAAGWGRPKALLLLDPEAAPSELKALARDLPERQLIDRVDEARSLLGGRPLLALMSVMRDGKDVDIAVTSRSESSLVGQLNSLTTLAPTVDQGFEIINLP